MKLFEAGKRALPHSWQSSYVPSDKGKQDAPGTWMRTYVNVKGKWCYLYRAIDRDGNLVDSMRSREARY
jgi:transposase-like protein